MLKYINNLALILVISANFAHAADMMTPSAWEELVGAENLTMLFVGNSLVYGQSAAYVAQVAEDTSLFGTIRNPKGTR